MRNETVKNVGGGERREKSQAQVQSNNSKQYLKFKKNYNRMLFF